jgi:hypothetical protein
MTAKYYLVVRDGNVLRGYATVGPAKAHRTRSIKYPVQIFVVDLALCYELDGPLVDEYEASERAIETIGLRADALKARVLAGEVKKPRKRSWIRCRARGCSNGLIVEYARYDLRETQGPPVKCAACGGTGKVLGG